MKFISSFMFMAFMALSFSVSAQQLVDYNYKAHSLGFKAPVGFTIDNNTAQEFVISDAKRGLTFYVRPYKDITVEDGLAVAKVAAENLATALSDIEITNEGEAQMGSGFNGYYFVGSGLQNGEAVIFVAIGAIDPDSDVNFYGVGMFYDNAQVDNNTTLVIKLLQSFKKI